MMFGEWGALFTKKRRDRRDARVQSGMRAMRNQSLLLQAPGRLEWVEEELPPPGPDDVLVRTIAGAVSVGSELPHYVGTCRHSMPDTYPRMTGYESVGTIVACRPNLRRLRPGDRVFSFYGHRTQGVVPEGRAISIPPDIE